jgi:asparagine synthase (glutamine-hydrolysing)
VFLGIVNHTQSDSELQQLLAQAAAQVSQSTPHPKSFIWSKNGLALYRWSENGLATQSQIHPPFWDDDRQIAVLFEGKIYNLSQLKQELGSHLHWQTDHASEVLAYLYDRNPDHFLEPINGKFSFVLWDARQQRLLLGRDRFGIQSLFYSHQPDRLVFGSSLRSLLKTGLIPKQLNAQVVLDYLLYCYNPGQQTFVESVQKVPASHFLTFKENELILHRYWNLSFAEQHQKTEAQYGEEIPALMEDAVQIRIDPSQKLGVFLSGGIDSSSMLSLASRYSTEPLSTFSFRCAGRSYDESSYAQYMAQQFKTNHTEVQYQPKDLSAITAIVQAMDEPFCDIGIEIGTYLLGQTAQGKVDYIFSGEGGDELFGGHPVYTADKVAVWVDWIPRSLSSPVMQLLQQIPDSDQKKNLQVKLKRFAYSLSFAPELLSHRWRIYYTPQELQSLCTSEFLSRCKLETLFESMVQYNKAADGSDRLSRSLYSDYWTLVNFYLRRLELLRSFGIDNSLPLLDYRLVEYAAKIPSSLKLRGFSDTKYIYKQALKGIVPAKILFDRPKLGHSVPMKNWLRENLEIQQWMREILLEGWLQAGNLFNSAFIQQMLQEHLLKTHNHSHRLWSLVVLKLWISEHLQTDTEFLKSIA